MLLPTALVLSVIAFALVAMARGASSELSLGLALAVLVLAGVVPVDKALSGFSNEQMHTVALLFLAAAALQRAGTLSLFSGSLLGKGPSATRALVRLTFPIALMSAVLNNTPLVAMMIPEVRSWCRRMRVPPSKLLIPLSYAAILGGLLTVIGTSTNLVVNGLVGDAGLRPIAFLEIGLLGAPVCVAGLLLLVVAGRWLLPERPDPDQAFENPQQFTSEVLVPADSKYAGKRLLDVDVPELGRFAPLEIVRGGTVVPAPRPDHVLQAGDRLVFAGPAATILALHDHPGLTTAPSQAFDVRDPKRTLAELVISARCPLVGDVVGEGTFRRHYNAAVIAVSRHGGRLPQKRLDDWVLRPGDIVLVETGADFMAQHRYSPDFYVATAHERTDPKTPKNAWLGFGVLLAMVGAAASGTVSMFYAVLAAVVALMLTRLLDRKTMKQGIEPGTLLTIAFSFGLGHAVESSGLARLIGETVTHLGQGNPWFALAVIYVLTSLLTEVVTNNAAAALMVPLALATAERLGVSHVPFAAALMVGASASFATPIGYTTNLMVYGAGGYRFTDFLRVGAAMNILVGVIAIALAPLIWPF